MEKAENMWFMGKDTQNRSADDKAFVTVENISAVNEKPPPVHWDNKKGI